MALKTSDGAVHEILQRAIRMETRMLQLGDHVGANLRSKQRIDIELTDGSMVAYVDSMDVSLSRVMAEVKRSKHWTRYAASPGHEDVIPIPIRMGNSLAHRALGTIVVPLRG